MSKYVYEVDVLEKHVEEFRKFCYARGIEIDFLDVYEEDE